MLRSAAVRARELGESHGWSRSTLHWTLDGLTVLLDGRPAGERVTLTEIRQRTPRQSSNLRVAEVLADLELLHDDSTPAIRSWIDRFVSTVPACFAAEVHAWLLELLNGNTRTRPRSHTTIRVFGKAVEPSLAAWAMDRGHLREVTTVDVTAALEPLHGWRRSTVLTALRSLFRFARKHGRIFVDPTSGIKADGEQASLLPLTDNKIRAIEHAIVTPLQLLIVALTAIHAVRPDTVRRLRLEDLDLANRHITLAGHERRLDELTHRVLRTWLEQRRTHWPHTPNRHLVISAKTALGTGPVGHSYLPLQLEHLDVDLTRIRGDCVLHEALITGPDPLHLALVFNLPLTTATRYVAVAQRILGGQPEQPRSERSLEDR